MVIMLLVLVLLVIMLLVIMIMITRKIIDIYNVDSTSLWVEIHQCE